MLATDLSSTNAQKRNGKYGRVIKTLKKGLWGPAAGEKILGYEALRGLSHTPPGVGGWVAILSGLRLYPAFLAAKTPMGTRSAKG